MLAGQSDRRPPQRRMNRRPPGRARPTPFLEPLSYAFHCQGLGSGWAVPHQSVLLVGSDDRLTVSKAGRSIHAGLPKGHEAFRALVRDRADLIAGDKGTGKTALYRVF